MNFLFFFFFKFSFIYSLNCLFIYVFILNFFFEKLRQIFLELFHKLFYQAKQIIIHMAANTFRILTKEGKFTY